MKLKYTIVPIAAALLAGTVAYADESHHGRAAGQGEPGLLAQAKPGKAASGTETQQIYDHMDMMQKKMARYHASKDQKERFKLRGELYADMRDHMKLMRGTGGDQKGRQETMLMRMDQTHQMMEWMFTFDTDFKPLGP